LPTSTQTPTTGTQLITKTYGDGTYAITAGTGNLFNTIRMGYIDLTSQSGTYTITSANIVPTYFFNPLSNTVYTVQLPTITSSLYGYLVSFVCPTTSAQVLLQASGTANQGLILTGYAAQITSYTMYNFTTMQYMATSAGWVSYKPEFTQYFAYAVGTNPSYTLYGNLSIPYYSTNSVVIGTNTTSQGVPTTIYGNLSVLSAGTTAPVITMGGLLTLNQITGDLFHVANAGSSTAYFYANSSATIGYWTGSVNNWTMTNTGALNCSTVSCTSINNTYSTGTSFQTASFTISAPFYPVYSLAPTANMTITLPTAASTNVGITLLFKRTGGTTTTTINSASSNIIPVNSTTTTTNVILTSSGTVATAYTARITCCQTGTSTYSWFFMGNV
jgi:hypothetical protein